MFGNAFEIPTAWIAKNYAETPYFADLLLSYINEHIDPSAKTTTQIILLTNGLIHDTLTW